jgi:hypothetical protein
MQSGDLMVVGGLRTDESGRDHQQPLPALGPLSEVLSGRFKQRIRGDVTVLVQAESMAALPAVQPDEVRP